LEKGKSLRVVSGWVRLLVSSGVAWFAGHAIAVCSIASYGKSW